MAFLLLLGAAAPSHAVSWYVSPNGSDAAPGSISQPFKTIKHASGVSLPGDTVYLRGGIYYPSSAEIVGNSGTGSLPIIIRPYPGELPVIDGSHQPGVQTTAGHGTDTLTIGASYVQILGLEIRNSSRTGLVIYGASNVVLRSNNIHDSLRGGMWIGDDVDPAATHDITVASNLVHDNAKVNTVHNDSGGSWPTAIGLFQVTRAYVQQNQVLRNQGEGIDAQNSNFVQISGNTSLDNYSISGVYIDNSSNVRVEKNFLGSTLNKAFYRSGYPGTCITTAREDAAKTLMLTNISIINNILVNCYRGYEHGEWSAGGGIRNLLFANNTMWNAAVSIKFDASAGHSNNVLANNVFSHPGQSSSMTAITATTGTSTVYFHHNDWYGGPAGRGAGPGDITSAPKLLNPGSFQPLDYRLSAGSPCTYAGATIAAVTDDYLGKHRTSPYDMGAFSTRP